MQEPRDLVAALERRLDLPAGTQERFSGYGVMGLPFPTGHVLAMRRFPASSVGPAYTSVWYLEPDRGWTFWQDVAPDVACPRFFGAALHDVRRAPITLEWTGPRRFHLVVDGDPGVDWTVELAPTAVTRAMNLAGSAMPASWWQHPRVLAAMSAVAGPLLRAGRLRLAGTVPNGQHFVATPLRVWTIPTTRAVIEATVLDRPGPAPEQAHLGDFAIPQRGVFAIGQAFFDPFDPSRHREATPGSR